MRNIWRIQYVFSDKWGGGGARNPVHFLDTEKSHLGSMQSRINQNTVEPLYNEVLGTMKITLLYQVSRYIRVKNTKKYKELGPAK